MKAPWMMLRRVGAGAAASVLVASLTCAQAADLLAVYRSAVDNDPTFAGQRDLLQVSQEQVTEARSGLLPALGATGQLGRSGGEVTYTDTPTVHRSYNALGWTLQLSQPLFRADNIVAYRQSKVQLQQSQVQLQQAQQDLMLHTVRAYFDVLIAQEAVEAADAEVKAGLEQQATAKHSFDAGVASVTDVDEATSRAALATSDQLAAQTDVQGKRAALEQIVGAIPGALAALRADAEAPAPDPSDAGQWSAAASENNPSVLAYKSAADAAHLNVERARMQRLPVIDAVASYGRNYSSGNDIDPINYATNTYIKQGGIQFSIPLLDGGALHAQVGEAQAKERKANADLEVARRQAVVDARNSYDAVVSGMAQVRALRTAIEASINSVKGNEAGYRLGIRINSDVLDSQRERYSTEKDLTKARYDTIYAALKLKAAAGTLQDSDLAAVNALLVEEATP